MPRVEAVPLSTARLDLQPLDPVEDAAQLHAMLADPRVYAFVAGARPSASVTETWARLAGELASNGGASWTIRRRGEPEALGTVGVRGEPRSAVLGLAWSVRPSHWGQGIATEAAAAVTAHLLAQPGVDGLEAQVDARNARSLAVARRAGLTERRRVPRPPEDGAGHTVVMGVGAASTGG